MIHDLRWNQGFTQKCQKPGFWPLFFRIFLRFWSIFGSSKMEGSTFDKNFFTSIFSHTSLTALLTFPHTSKSPNLAKIGQNRGFLVFADFLPIFDILSSLFEDLERFLGVSKFLWGQKLSQKSIFHDFADFCVFVCHIFESFLKKCQKTRKTQKREKPRKRAPPWATKNTVFGLRSPCIMKLKSGQKWVKNKSGVKSGQNSCHRLSTFMISENDHFWVSKIDQKWETSLIAAKPPFSLKS